MSLKRQADVNHIDKYIRKYKAGEVSEPLPHLIIIVDEFAELKAEQPEFMKELISAARIGRSLGVHLILATQKPAGQVNEQIWSNSRFKLCLKVQSKEDSNEVLKSPLAAEIKEPGRAYLQVGNNEIFELFQSAYSGVPEREDEGTGKKEFERAEAIRGYIEKRNGECTEVARKIPLIPPVLSMNYMAQQFGNMMRGHFDLAAGLNYEDVMPYMLRMSSIGVLAVVGREGSGRYNWIKYVADMLELMYPGRSKVYISDGIGKKLASMKEKRNVVRYSMIAEDIVSYLKEIEEELQSRYELLAKGIESDPAEADYMLLIIDNPDAIEQISNSKEALASYKNIIGRYRNMNVGVIISAIENAPIPYSAPEVIKGIRDGRHLMYFGDISELKIYDMPLAVTRKFKKPIETGDGYYIKENECIKLKTPFIAGE